jgi:Novel STAND NTPase 1
MNSLLLFDTDQSFGIEHRLLEPEQFLWPVAPYKGLNFYSYRDAPLLGQRDSEAQYCASLLGSASNRVLLLHGRSAAGKSSFLRAGLLPRLAQTRFALMRTSLSEEPLLVRCTDDPIARIYEQLAIVATSIDAPLYVRSSVREKIAALVSEELPVDRELAVSRLMDVFDTLSDATRPLVIVVDQAEEIFTLALNQSRLEGRFSFFDLIERICVFEPLVKLVVSLRTEYYGQFCDQLRINPHSVTGTEPKPLEHFMLRGLRTHDQIVRAILAPTERNAHSTLGAPYDFYNFEFAPGVADQMARDLLEHCGESCILPVLQIVCKDLYQHVVTATNRQISLRDYDRLGRVDGRVSAFIEGSIRSVLNDVNKRKVPGKDVQRWERVLSTLVARQDGGALTTLVADESALLGRAKRAGISSPSAEYLQRFAQEDPRLLRQVSFKRTDNVRQYSLGHDALGPALYQAKIANEQYQIGVRHFRRVLAFVLCIVLTTGVFVAAQAYATRWQNVATLVTFATRDRSPDLQNKLLLLLGALHQSSTLWGFATPHATVVSELKRVLSRAPTLGGDARAVALSPTGEHLAVLEGDNVVNLYPLRERWGSDTNDAAPTRVGSIPPSHAGRELFQVPVIGFINELKQPVVFYDGSLYWWTNEHTSIDQPYFIDLSTLLGSLRPGVWRMPDFSAGALWVTQIEMLEGSARRFTFVSINFRNGQFNADPIPGEVVLPFPFSPVYAAKADLMAVLRPDRDNGNAGQQREGAVLQVSLRESPNGAQTIATFPVQQGNAAAQPFIRSVAFSNSGSEPALVVRDAEDRLSAFPFDAHSRCQAGLTFSIPERTRDIPVRPLQLFLRPVLAVSNERKQWSFSWLGNGGVLVMKATDDGHFCNLETIPFRADPVDARSTLDAQHDKSNNILLPAVTLDTVTRLEFTAGGRFLMLQGQPTFTGQIKYRVWDLTSEHFNQLNKLDEGELEAAACQTAAIEGRATKTGAGEELMNSQDVNVLGFSFRLPLGNLPLVCRGVND